MRLINKILLIACLGTASLAFAQDGCFYKLENAYLGVGAMRADITGDIMCSKLSNGAYVWVTANEFDKSGGCWYVDKYPVGSIVNQAGDLRQCILGSNKNYYWIHYKA